VNVAEAREYSCAVLCEELVEEKCPFILCESISVLPRPSFLLECLACV